MTFYNPLKYIYFTESFLIKKLSISGWVLKITRK
jgi:hypothetical protein